MKDSKCPSTKDIVIPLLFVVACVLIYPSSSPRGSGRNHLSASEARKYIDNYKYSHSSSMFKEGYISRAEYDQIVSQPACNGVKCYLGKLDNDSITVVAIGVDSTGKELSDGIIANGTVTYSAPDDTTCELEN